MEELHPIPQNVTSFEFKLIGDMTLKQFGYLVAGAGTAYFIFVFLAHDYPLTSWPLIISSALLGVAFAFLPIGSRPLDHWTKAFLKAIYSPTKRVWGKNGKTFREDPLFGSRLIMYLAGNSPSSPREATPASPAFGVASRSERGEPAPPDQGEPKSGEESKTQSIASVPKPAEAPALQRVEPLPSQEELKKTVDLARQAQSLQMKIIQTERTLSQIKAETQKPTPIPVDYSEQVNKILADLRSLIDQASAIKQQIKSVQEPKTESFTPLPVSREKVKVVIMPRPKQTTVALTIFPNVINGIVKDKANNYLEGAVAVIYDKEGLPVRALKTNKLGQFSGSTPLPNGTFTLELEKENFAFDVLQIELSGAVLPPLLITAK